MRVLLNEGCRYIAYESTLNMPVEVLAENARLLLIEITKDLAKVRFKDVASAMDTLPLRRLSELPCRPDIVVRIKENEFDITY
jgi:hypothetical protein